MFGERLLLVSSGYFVALLLVLVPVPSLCSARNTINYTCSSSCGSIPNITWPFRLRTDPIGCGLSINQLDCVNNTTIFTFNSVKHQVQAIDYKNQRIRLKDPNVDKDNCSSIPLHDADLPPNFEWSDHFHYIDEYHLELPISLTFIKCGNPVNSPLYVDTSPCINSSEGGGYSYVMVGPTNVTEFVDSCSIVLMTKTSWVQLHNNVSYMNIHDSMAYGFNLRWDLYSFSSAQPTLLRDLSIGFGYLLVPLDYLWLALKLPWSLYYFGDSIQGPIWKQYLHFFLRCLVFLFVLYHIVLFICGVPCIFAFLIYKWRRRHMSLYNDIEKFLQNQANFMPIRYSYSHIKKITNGFKEKLGEGGFGSVYKGKLRSGCLVAVKMLDKSKANGKDFINEVGTIGKIHHVNVVQLLGFCVEGSHQALVYEFLINGSLDKFIFSQENNKILSDKKMYEISLGIARGMEYLHRGCNMQILHFDIKPHNILLDENFMPKISDFGLAKLCPTNSSVVSLTAARGTMGYMAPELVYKSIRDISYKADVYSFGMLLMEMASKRKNVKAFTEHLSRIYFPTWAYDQFSKGKDIELGDATEEERSTTKKMIMVALWCIQLKSTDRPPMHKVIDMLERNIKYIEMPPKPSLSLRDETE